MSSLIQYIRFTAYFFLFLTPALRQCNGFIVNGKPASAKETEHQGSLRLKTQDSKKFGDGHICGGVLITPTTVLSAAHCFESEIHPEDYYFVMGTTNRVEKTASTLLLEIRKILIHPNYNIITFENDLALIYLDKNVAADSPGVDFIQLIDIELAADTICQVNGWGVTERGKLSEKLMTIDVQIVDREVCALKHGPDVIFDGMICAANVRDNKDACDGDSGGGLVHNKKLVAILSSGRDPCAYGGYPSLYIDVMYHKKWIEEHMNYLSNQRTDLFIVLKIGITLLIVLVLYIMLCLYSKARNAKVEEI